MKSLFGGSAIIASAIIAGSIVFSPSRLEAETLSIQFNRQILDSKTDGTLLTNVSSGSIGTSSSAITGQALGTAIAEVIAAPASPYVATAYTLRGRTASGRQVAKGLIAADPRVLPLGSRVRIDAGTFSGEYLVADTGGAVRGKRIDIWTPSNREAFRFGKRTIKLTVLSYGPRWSGSKKAKQ
jgi:3D (Asp-Asp-Asp) domain-containing protein